MNIRFRSTKNVLVSRVFAIGTSGMLVLAACAPAAPPPAPTDAPAPAAAAVAEDHPISLVSSFRCRGWDDGQQLIFFALVSVLTCYSDDVLSEFHFVF